MHIRDRIQELRRVPAAELLPNPRNWRTHPQQQREALQAVLAEIGYAHALLARETADGRLMLIDGHLRAETTPTSVIPVLVLDVTEEEADKLLVTLDPLSSLAGVDSEKLSDLLAGVRTGNSALQGLLDELTKDSDPPFIPAQAEVLHHQHDIIITCNDEQHQIDLLQRFTDEGLKCRALVV